MTPTRRTTQNTDNTSPWSEESQTNDIEEVNAALREVAARRVTREEAVEYRVDDSPKLALPIKPKKMTYAEGAKFLAKAAEAEEEMYEFSEIFLSRPYDGAVAFNKVLKDAFGISAIGKAIHGWGGSQLPELITVHTSATEAIQVPWGLLEFPPWGAQFMLSATMHKSYGPAFTVTGHAKKKFEGEIQGLFKLVHQYLDKNSIYRGKALEGTGIPSAQGYSEPEFLDVYSIDRNEIVYNSDVFKSLWHGLWGRIQAREKLASIGRRFAPKILLHGENGTGKTVAALITAQYCLENGLTFIKATPDEDLAMVMRFAEHVGTPAVVAVEDAEKLIDENPQKMDQLLEIFDGMRTKGLEVGLLLTTNHPDELPPAILRARRISRAIYISDLDPEALRRLIDIKIPEEQREDLDYDVLAGAFEGFKPSWIVQVLEDAVDASVIRTGEIGQPLATDDFVQEALVLRQLHDMHQRSLERPKAPELTTAFKLAVAEVMRDSVYVNDDGEISINA